LLHVISCDVVSKPGELLLNPPNRERPTISVFWHIKQKE